MQACICQQPSANTRSTPARTWREFASAGWRPRALASMLASLLVGSSLMSSPRAAVVDCQANRPGAGSVLYLYFPTASDSDFPDDPGGWGVSTSPLAAFDVADLDASIGSTAQLRNAITDKVRSDYCEFDVRVVQTTSANGTTDPPPSDPRWQIVGVGSDSNSGLFGIAEDFDDFDSNETDYARVWAGTFRTAFGGPGGALNGADSTLERWANAIGGTISHEGGHNYGPDHPDAAPVTSEDDEFNHLMSSPPSGEDRAQDRHFSNTSFEILARNLGLYEQTVSNWDFVNPNDSTADGFRITVLVRPADGTPGKGSMYTGGLSPWEDVSIGADGSETFKGENYDRFVVTFTDPKAWDNGTAGRIPAGESFHVGVGLTTDYIVRDVELTSGGSPMDLRPRVVGYTTGGSFDPATGAFHVTFSNPDPENGPLILSDFVVRYLPRTVDINEMVVGGQLVDFDGRPLTPWSVRGTEQDRFTVVDTTDVTIGNLAEKRAVDFIATPPKECGLIKPQPVPDAVAPNRMEYCRNGHILGLFPSTRVYFEATLTDPQARYFDRDLQRFVVGPLKSRIFVQLSGVTPDLNDNGIDDAIDISSGACADENRNGVCDDVEPRYRYSAKVVCGLQPDPAGLRLAPAHYATAINILNPSDRTARFGKTLALTFPPDGDQPGAVLSLGKASLAPGEAVEVDCIDIGRKLFPTGLPQPYLKGFVVLRSDQSLDVTAVYTASGLEHAAARCEPEPGCCDGYRKDLPGRCGKPDRGCCEAPPPDRCPKAPQCCRCGADTQFGTISIDVEQISERRIELRQPPPPRCPDLVVSDIGAPQVSCPAGAGSCETRVRVAIANIGNADAGSFDLRTVFDPEQSVTVMTPVTGGLAAGASASLAVATPPGGNCFDPDCTIRADVDSKQAVRECKEDNNSREETTPG